MSAKDRPNQWRCPWPPGHDSAGMADQDLRRIGLVAATAIVVANMIGTGVFTTTGFMASDLGDAGAILAAWVAGGLLALCGAAAYAELGGIWPRVGGEY